MEGTQFADWIKAMDDAEPRFRDTLLVASNGVSPAEWRNYDPEPDKQASVPSVHMAADQSVADLPVISDDEIIVIMDFDQIRKFLNRPSLERLAILVMSAPDGQDRVYTVTDCGDKGLYVKVLMGVTGSPLGTYRMTNNLKTSFPDLFDWLSARPSKNKYVPRPIHDAARLIDIIGSTN